MKKIISTVLLSLTVFVFVSCSAQRVSVSDDASTSKFIDSLLAGKQFSFVAERVNSTITDRNPTLGNINGERYYIKLMKDSVSGYLPFFGRAYQATPNSKGIEFDTKHFSYDIKDGKKNSRVIKLEVRDLQSADSYQITMTVMSNGNAYVNVNSNRREAISYYGKIEPLKEKK